ILLLIRNPKDVATSFYHFCNGLPTLPSYETWDDFFTDFMTKKMAWGSYFEYLSEWNKYADKENIMTITYEEVKEVREILHLENGSTSFGVQCNKNDSSIKYKTKCLGFQEIFFCFFEGGVSDWKNLFTEDQNEKMDKAFEEHIAGTKLGKKLKYDLYCKA
ncbi:ST6B1 Sulfotransferase, partial [Calcarius ornatus]|nr:ST6B1 Sulfotransferase [Calcarius ornatus]